MSRNAYITEAFKQFNTLMEEDDELITREEVPVYDIDSEKMHDFLDTAGDDTDVDIIDIEAEVEEDLKQSYVGKVILDCNVCHSNIFVDKDDIVVNEDGIANLDLECPYCMSNEGYTIIGQVEPYSEEDEVEDEVEEIEDEVGIEDETDIFEEGYKKGLREGLRRSRRRKIKESIQDVSITTDDETMTMTTKEDGGISIETSPITGDEDFMEDDFMEEESFDDFGDEDFETGEEVIAPLSTEDEDEIELNSEVDMLSDEDIDDIEAEDEIDIEDFDEDSFDQLGESYLKKHYDNVAGFKTVNAKVFNNSLIVEGVIRFTSGNAKGTSFVFEATKSKKNGILFEGYNEQISRGKKTFKLTCGLKEGLIKPVKMTYNYMTKNELNESVRVNGTCKVGK